MIDSFINDLISKELDIIDQLRNIIKSNDTLITERVEKIMSSNGAIVYEQDGIFKYGLAKTKNHFTFHSMVMYAFPKVMEFSKQHLTGKGIKFQKGCINFSTLDLLSIQSFQEVLALSAKQNFETVINHYKKK